MEREDRVIYTSHYNHITSVHLMFSFFPIRSDDAKVQNKQNTKTTDTLKKNKLYNISMQFVLINPGLV